MFEGLIEQRDEVVWILEYLNQDCRFSESVAKLRRALINSLLDVDPPQAEEIQQRPITNSHEEKKRFVTGVNDAVDQICIYLGQVRWSEHVRARIGHVSPEGEPFNIQKDEEIQIIQMKQWVNALYHLEQGLRVIESKELTTHLKRYAETKNTVYLAGSLIWNRSELNALYNAIITPIHRAFYLITHIELDLKFIFEEELKSFSVLWAYWTSNLQMNPQATDVLNLGEKAGFFLGLLLDQLRPSERGGMNYSLVTRAAAMLPGLKRYFDKTPFEKQKADLIVLSKRLLGDFGFNDRGFINDFFELVYQALASHSDQDEPVGELPTVDGGPVKRLLQLLFYEKKKQEKNLGDLQETALKLKHALSELQDGGILALINYIYIARHGWNLACVIQEESTALKDGVQALILEGIVHVRDYRLPKLLALVDKLEEVFMFAPGFLSKPAMMMLDSYYRGLISQLPIPHVGSLLSSGFLLERFRLAEIRHKKYVEHVQCVVHVLKPALQGLMVADAAYLENNWPKLYRPLQKYLETQDPKLSNDLLRMCRSSSRDFTKFIDFFTNVEARLRSLEKTHKFSVKLTLAKAHMLRECQGLDSEGILFMPAMFEQHASENKFAQYWEAASSVDNFKPACARRLKGYLVTDISEHAPVRKMAMVLRQVREAIKANLDPEAHTESSLNFLHIANMLKFLEQSCEALELLCDTDSKWFFVAQTIVLFKTWVFASAVLPPYLLEANVTYHNEVTGIRDWIKKQARYYDVSYHEPEALPAPDPMFHVMNALAIFPMHMHALHAKQDELSEKMVLATHKKALEASVDFLKIMKASDSLIGLMLEYYAIWNLFSNAKSMGKTFLNETYTIATEDGLNDLVERFFFSLLHQLDLYEIKLGFNPDFISGKVEPVIDKFFRGLLEPLGLPSNNYIALMSNRAPYDRRFRSLPDTTRTHQIYFRAMYSEAFFENLAMEARNHCIDEAMKREFKRLDDRRTGLQHATNDMYFKAFKLFVRPDIDVGVKGDAGIEKQVCEILQIKMREFQERHDQDCRRLDVILEVIADLNKYLAVPAEASLFETKETHRRKRRKVEELEKIARDVTCVPGERIQKIRQVMKRDNFQEKMLAYAHPDWFTYDAFKRAVLWILECVGLYTPDSRTHYNNLVRSVRPETNYLKSPLIELGLFNTPVSSYERVEDDEAVFKKLGVTLCEDLNESLASSHEPS